MDELMLRVAARTRAADGVTLIELRAAEKEGALPGFKPGAHIEVQLASDLRRHYSLCNDPAERDCYRIAVALAEPSRGGSAYIHHRLRAGDIIVASTPRNNFPLVEDAERYQFIAGGIGITPILPMLRWCAANRRSWNLLYLLRSRARAAFLPELERFAGHVRAHFDDEAGGVFDVDAALSDVAPDAHIYCCGPGPLMDAVEKAAADRDSARVHFEWFTPKDQSQLVNTPFTAILARSRREIAIPADKTILETLEADGMKLPFSCREGLCATCETAVLAGAPDHRDQILTPQEKRAGKSMMICVSRAKTPAITLDL
ncbi:MAG: PDR/VanB family oxidoreductase [Pseudomonadota bacterium]